jgi:hypothetical protein
VPQEPTNSPTRAQGQPAGKTQATLEAAAVASDQLLAAGVRNPVVVYAGAGRSAELRARLDELGAAAVQVQELGR